MNCQREIHNHAHPEHRERIQKEQNEMTLQDLAEKLRREQTTEQMLDAFVADAVRSAKFVQEQYLAAIKTLIAWPEIRDAAYKKYAADIGHALVTDAEKRQALLNHVAEKYE